MICKLVIKKLGFFLVLSISDEADFTLLIECNFPLSPLQGEFKCFRNHHQQHLGKQELLWCCRESSQQLCTPCQLHFSPSSHPLPMGFPLSSLSAALDCSWHSPSCKLWGIQERGRVESYLENSVLTLPWALSWFLYLTVTPEINLSWCYSLCSLTRWQNYCSPSHPNSSLI